jgi:hypothetical protein
MSIDRLDPGPHLSHAMRHGPTIYLAGMTATIWLGDIATVV